MSDPEVPQRKKKAWELRGWEFDRERGRMELAGDVIGLGLALCCAVAVLVISAIGNFFVAGLSVAVALLLGSLGWIRYRNRAPRTPHR